MQLYLLTTQWAQELVQNAEGLDPHTRKKAEFYVQQITNAIAPSNFVLTNPEVLRETLASNGDNLVRGMKMLAEDIEAGHGTLRIRQSDPANLEVGVNMATTPGKVIFQNELMQLIQYTPTTETVLRTPLLIVPPWINKFYILDLKPEKSYIKWCVDQGITVFVISWVNPGQGARQEDLRRLHEARPARRDGRHRKGHRRDEGPHRRLLRRRHPARLDAGVARREAPRSASTSATFFAAQVDFTHAGDLLVFVDEEQISALERDMEAARRARRQQDGDGLQHAALERPDLVLCRQQLPEGPAALRRSTCCTGIPTRRGCRRPTIPTICATAIWRTGCPPAAWCSTTRCSTSPRSRCRSTIWRRARITSRRRNRCCTARSSSAARSSTCCPAPATSPAWSIRRRSGKYQYWTNDNIKDVTLADWLKGATEHKGSWWPDWRQWLESLDAEEVPARAVGTEAMPPIEDAPGSYVRVRA